MRELREMYALPAVLTKIGGSWQTWVCATLGGAIDYLFPTEAVQVAARGVFVLFVCDWILGVLVAVVEKNVNSAGFRRAFVKLVAYACYIAIGATVPAFVPAEVLSGHDWLKFGPVTAILTGLAFNDAISGLEKLKKLGVGVDNRFVQFVMDRIGAKAKDGK